MATKADNIIKKLIEAIDNRVNSFNESIPGIQQSLLDDLISMTSELKVSNGKLATTAENLKLLTKIKSRISKAILSGQYKKKVKEFITGYDEIEKLQTEYFQQVTKTYKPPKVLEAIREAAIQSTLDYLTDAGIGVNVSDKIAKIISTNITTGAKYSDLVKQLRSSLLNDQTGAGILERYTKQITTDTLNQYSASNMRAVSDDLGLDWYMYDGAVIATSRTFCEALVKKKYIHKSELSKIIKGDFAEFKKLDGEINQKTKLPAGMIAGTTPENFHVYRGGYQCGHQLIPVDAAVVPEAIRMKFGK